MTNADRYIRQTTLKGFGREGQEKLLRSKVLVVGAGGLGVPVLQYLNAMGVGTIGIIENDIIDHSNLHRQVIFDESDVNKPKIQVITDKLSRNNSSTRFIIHETFLTLLNALEIISDYDMVLDCSDNFPTRYLVNDACVILNKPFISGAVQGFEGQLSVFNYKNGPSYRCLFPEMPASDEIPDCNSNGVLGILPGIIGNLQALEAVKVITGIGQPLSGELLLYDGLQQTMLKIRFGRNEENFSITELRDSYEQQACSAENEISPETYVQMLNAGIDFQLIDVRSENEFLNFHLDGSLNIPLDELDINTIALDHSRPAVFICQSGLRSIRAIALLQQKFKSENLINLKGGLNNYLKYAATHQ